MEPITQESVTIYTYDNRSVAKLVNHAIVNHFDTFDWIDLAVVALNEARRSGDWLDEAIESLDFERLIATAQLYGCDAEPSEWLDDDYPLHEQRVRDELYESIESHLKHHGIRKAVTA